MQFSVYAECEDHFVIFTININDSKENNKSFYNMVLLIKAIILF